MITAIKYDDDDDEDEISEKNESENETKSKRNCLSFLDSFSRLAQQTGRVLGLIFGGWLLRRLFALVVYFDDDDDTKNIK